MTDQLGPADLPPEVRDTIALEGIFMPYLRRQRDRAYEGLGSSGRLRLAHYTSAEAALKIIRSKRLWMRNARCMSDYSEVQHGDQLLRGFFGDVFNRQEFLSALDASVPGAGNEGFELYERSLNDLALATYIASASEHHRSEDSHGRLSMWRAFGGNKAGVAIVLGIPWYSRASLKLSLVVSPVAYLSADEVNIELRQVIKNVRDKAEFMRSVNRVWVVGWVYNMLAIGAVCLKHKGFHEELEWRGIHFPGGCHRHSFCPPRKL